MKIGVDAGCLAIKNQNQKTGVYQMAFNLLTNLAKIDEKNQYELYSFAPIELPASLRKSQMKNVVLRPARGWRWLALPQYLRRHPPDVFLGLSQALPVSCPCPAVIIVHDLAFERWPEFYSHAERLKRVTRSAVKKAAKIITVSQATKKDLIRLYGLPAAKIKVAHEGCNRKIFKPRPGPKKPYFLFVGADKPIKNIVGLKKAFAKTGLDYRLILVGSNSFVSQAKLVRLYQQATALASPAFYEGFGLPLVEAMACGCPVIAGQGGSQPEVVGQAGILVAPENYQALARAMIRVAQNKQQREKMIRKGLKQAQKFSWSEFARNVLQTINES